LPPECFKKLYPIFLNAELNRNKLEIDKWDIKINKLIEYKYKDDP
jgi:ribosomal protein L33